MGRWSLLLAAIATSAAACSGEPLTDSETETETEMGSSEEALTTVNDVPRRGAPPVEDSPKVWGKRPLRLRFRDVQPPDGVDPELREHLDQRKSQGGSLAHVVVQRASIPGAEEWERLRAWGIEAVLYLGEATWVLGVDLSAVDAGRLTDAMRAFEAQSVTFLRPEDKASPDLVAVAADPRGGDKSVPIELTVSFYTDVSEEVVSAWIEEAHTGDELARSIGNGTWQIVTTPALLADLLADDSVALLERGPIHAEPLMDVARRNTGAESVQAIQSYASPPTYSGFTGQGVRMSNSEGFDINHDDFWNHDASGNRTTARWLGCGPGSEHGTMTAGIMLGNGWRSGFEGGTSLQYRGIAPEATFACPGDADVQSSSFTEGLGEYNSSSAATDSTVRAGIVKVGAAANQGITPQYGVEKGYYSLYRNAKNEIIVANFDQGSFRWNQSSLGPTWDGRIKPDIAAPGAGTLFPRSASTVALDIDSVQVVRTVNNTATVIRDWSFGGSGWQGGWGDCGANGFYCLQNIAQPTQIVEGPLSALRAALQPPPYGQAYQNRPILGTQSEPGGGPLALVGDSHDTVQIRYRLPAVADWSPVQMILQWSKQPLQNWQIKAKSFSAIADNQWHTATVQVNNSPDWVTQPGETINFLSVRFMGTVMSMPTPGNLYGNASGSSAASPVVAGAAALLLDQLHRRLNVTIGDHVAPSPFAFGAPGVGVPLPSTFRALLTHTARDLAVTPGLAEPANPDTGSTTLFHKGPDLVSGYGMVDVAEAARLVEAEATAIAQSPSAPRSIVERTLTTGAPHVYTIQVPAGARVPLKVTLAWDDPPGAVNSAVVVPKLVNDLDLKLKAPSGIIHYPWTIDAPYTPQVPSQYPNVVEPEPITAASIQPARRDHVNTRDNLEQVYVEFPEAGTWEISVSPAGLALPPQKYSLILGTPPKPASNLQDGKVVFSSNRVTPMQIFVQPVGATSAPTQVTFGGYEARYPAWSPDGKYIAYVTKHVLPGVGPVDALFIMDAQGNTKAVYPGPVTFGAPTVRAPDWSPDGKRIVVNLINAQGAWGLSTLDFTAPYGWSSPASTKVLVPFNPAAYNPGDGVFSRDGRTIYFGGDSSTTTGGIFRIPSAGGQPFQLWGDGAPARRAYAVSVSADGRHLIFNSEMYKDGDLRYIDEELVDLRMPEGTLDRLTMEPGNQYGSFAINARDNELVMVSNPSQTGNNDIYLQQNGARVPLYIADPGNAYNDRYARWWKAPLPVDPDTMIVLPQKAQP